MKRTSIMRRELIEQKKQDHLANASKKVICNRAKVCKIKCEHGIKHTINKYAWSPCKRDWCDTHKKVVKCAGAK